MKTSTLIEQLLNTDTLGALEKLAGPLRIGRNMIFGFPVDVDADSTVEEVEMRGVDEDATRQVIKLLRAKGFQVVFHKGSDTFVVSWPGSRGNRADRWSKAR